MKVINPAAITPATLVNSSVPEADYPTWNAGTAYATGARVITTETHRVYEAAAANLGTDPTAAGQTAWIPVGPTNRWAMFDQAVGSSTVGTGSVSVVVAPGAVGALAVIDTDAETVRVQVVVQGTSVYDRTQSTNAGGGVIQDWEQYFDAELGKVMVLSFFDLVRHPDAQIYVTLTGADPNGPVSAGTLIVGNMLDLGSTEAGAQIGIIDYSRKATDDFGNTDVVERAWAKRMTIRSLLPMNAVDGTQRRVAALRAKASLWIGEDGFDSLAVYGFFKDFSIDLTIPPWSYCSLTIEGLI